MEKGSREIWRGTEPRDTAAFQQWGRRGVHNGNRRRCQKAGGDQRQASSHPVTPSPRRLQISSSFHTSPPPSLTPINSLKSLIFVNTEESPMPRETSK